LVRRGEAWQARLGRARPGQAGRGVARLGLDFIHNRR
jgi:hypothetical protein